MAALVLKTHPFAEDASGDALFQLSFTRRWLRFLSESGGNA